MTRVLICRMLVAMSFRDPQGIRDLEWQGAQDRLKPLCRELGNDKLPARVPRWMSASPAT
jgi:hypothetical protein